MLPPRQPVATDAIAEPGPLVVRLADDDDLEPLVALEQHSFPGDRMSRRQYRRHLHSTSARLLVAQQHHHLVGSALLFLRNRSRVARLYSLAVDGAVRGQGVGARLLQAVIDAARKESCSVLRLEVRTDNTAAIALYVRAGFQRIDRLSGYYDDGADGWRFQRLLDSTP